MLPDREHTPKVTHQLLDGPPDRALPLREDACSRTTAVAALLVIRTYQRLVSSWLPPACRFSPSCSEYALGAIRRFGLARGGKLAAARVARCHPWNEGGFDPIPSRQDGSQERNHGSKDATRRRARYSRLGRISDSVSPEADPSNSRASG